MEQAEERRAAIEQLQGLTHELQQSVSPRDALKLTSRVEILARDLGSSGTEAGIEPIDLATAKQVALEDYLQRHSSLELLEIAEARHELEVHFRVRTVVLTGLGAVVGALFTAILPTALKLISFLFGR